MGNICILDGKLELVGMIDAYRSFIWTNRYNALGACELYVQANSNTVSLCVAGNYICRSDDLTMVCIITRVELDTDAENGNYLIVNGIDAKALLDRRIIWGMRNINGNAQTALNAIVADAVTTSDVTSRQMLKTNGGKLFATPPGATFNEQLTQQVSYRNIGEYVREVCAMYEWGYRVAFIRQVDDDDDDQVDDDDDDDVIVSNQLRFETYKGTDRSDSVVFSDAFENLISTKYISDETDLKNAALIAGQETDEGRVTQTITKANGVNRAEIFVDARDLQDHIQYSELIELFPGGQVVEVATGSYQYRLNKLIIPIISEDHKNWLQEYYPTSANYTSTVTTINGQLCYQMISNPASSYNIPIAVMSTNRPTDDTEVGIYEIIYVSFLQARGAEKLAEYGKTQTFEGIVSANSTFNYRQHYFLGDIVKITNNFGISAEARIIEVTETFDENGYNVDPKFEYKQIN